ncbi:MAG: hypothetical protein JSV56_12850 [Methanomassiliicoccales archaeon]|nr:MAG: hypothetical protein JSV56_12850 [Methanomassiliicoccales archaeon]
MSERFTKLLILDVDNVFSMSCERKWIVSLAVVFLILYALYFSSSSFSSSPTPLIYPEPPDWGIIIEFDFDKPLYNLSESNDPITFHGWVNYTGVPTIPFTLHISAQSDIGEVYLSQSDFTFRASDSIPFNGLNQIQQEGNFTTEPQLTISGYIQKGGLTYEVPPSTSIIPIVYYEEEVEEQNETREFKQKIDSFFILGIPSLLILYGFYIAFVRRKLWP